MTAGNRAAFTVNTNGTIRGGSFRHFMRATTVGGAR